MSKDRHKKVEKRARRQREEHERLRGLRARIVAKTHPCPDCEDACRDDKPTMFHRTGPCGASKEKIAALKARLKGKDDRWEKAKQERILNGQGNVPPPDDGVLPCYSCSRKITEDEESWREFEGEIIWIGCDHCHGLNDNLSEDRFAELRLAWPENKAKIQEIEKHIETEAKKRFERFVAPFVNREGMPPGASRSPMPAGVTLRPAPEVLGAKRSIYDMAMDKPVPWPTLPQGPGIQPPPTVIHLPAAARETEKAPAQ